MKNFNQFNKTNESIQLADTKLSTLQSYCEDLITNILQQNNNQEELKQFVTQVLNIVKEIKIELKNQY